MNNVDLRMGTLAGTVLSVSLTMNIGNLLETVILAAIGASVSFAVSLFWKNICKKEREK